MTSTHLVPAGQSDALSALVADIAGRVAAMPALPADDGERYSIRRLTVTWLLDDASPHTRTAHLRDLDTFLAWCQHEHLDPLSARTADITQFRTWRQQRTHRGKSAAASTVARALASVSSWYTHLVANSAERVPRNPAAAAKRPTVNAHTSSTAGLTLHEVDLLLAQADTVADACTARWRAAPESRHSQTRYLAALRDRALLRLLADLGLRIGEALDRDVDDLTHNAGHRTLRYLGKGGVARERSLPPHTVEALDDYLTARTALTGPLTGPLFATTGTSRPGRLAEPNVFIWLRRLATAAGVPSAARLSPHSLRHAFATGARAQGVALEDVQDAMGHADPRTTRRYDRDRHNLDRDPSHVLSAHRASRRRPADSAANTPSG